MLISTTEHLLSACIGAGIDNAIVELDNLELPILDGSASPFVEMIQKAGVRRQRKARTYLRMVGARSSCARATSSSPSIPRTAIRSPHAINFPVTRRVGGRRFVCGSPMAATWSRMAPARTFGFLHEADAMRQQGLIRGASAENAIVLTRDDVLNPPLAFPR